MSKLNKPTNPAPAKGSFGKVPEMIEKQMNSSTNMGYSPFEPAPEEVELPSRGKFYHTKNTSLKQSQGKILIKPMTFKEETLLNNPRVIKTGSLLNSLLSSTIRTPGIEVEHLLSCDRIFLFYYLRSISYGDKYKFPIICSVCSHIFQYTTELSKLEVVYADEAIEPIECVLPKANKKVLLRFSRGVDEPFLKKIFEETEEETNKTNAKKILSEEVNPEISGLIRLTVQIDGVPKDQWKLFYENLSVQDAHIVKTAIGKCEPGLRSLVEVPCPKCNAPLVEGIPLSAGFFRVESD